MKQFLLKLFIGFIKILKLATRICIVILLITFLVQFISNPEKYPSLNKLNKVTTQICAPVSTQIKLAMPTVYHGVDLSKIILIFLFLIFLHICHLIQNRLEITVSRKSYDEWRLKRKSALPEEKISELDTKFKAIGAAKKSDRKKLLEEFVALKNQLDTMGQELAFLAIDVVDSTGMKKDEDKHLSSFAFDAYNKLVEECLIENGVIKFAMTPDGIMSCFRTIDNAVAAATDLLEKLVVFNKSDKQIKSDFHIRCGINAGFVYLDEETPLEQVSDRAIDIAGHMQKHAKPDSINIAASAIEPLKQREGFVETTDVIDEQRVFEWTKK